MLQDSLYLIPGSPEQVFIQGAFMSGLPPYSIVAVQKKHPGRVYRLTVLPFGAATPGLSQ